MIHVPLPNNTPPIREIVFQDPRKTSMKNSKRNTTKLPKAPLLYRWENNHDHGHGHGLDNDNHLNDLSRSPPTSSKRTTEAPRQPVRDDTESPQAQDDVLQHELQQVQQVQLPPRRPRRCKSPPRNPMNIDIYKVVLSPLELVEVGAYDDMSYCDSSISAPSSSSDASYSSSSSSSDSDSDSDSESEAEQELAVKKGQVKALKALKALKEVEAVKARKEVNAVKAAKEDSKVKAVKPQGFVKRTTQTHRNNNTNTNTTNSKTQPRIHPPLSPPLSPLSPTKSLALKKTVGDLIMANKDMLDNTNTTSSPNPNPRAQADVTMLFCVRRSGCGNCREHAVQLHDLYQKVPFVNLKGVLKPEPVRKELLREFKTYFPFDLYVDQDWKLFQAMGNRKLSLWKLLTRAPSLEPRYAKKNIVNRPFGGDLFTHGGVLIFDNKGRLRFVYYEKYGDELDMEALEWAVHEARKPLPGDVLNDRDDDQHHHHSAATTSRRNNGKNSGVPESTCGSQQTPTTHDADHDNDDDFMSDRDFVFGNDNSAPPPPPPPPMGNSHNHIHSHSNTTSPWGSDAPPRNSPRFFKRHYHHTGMNTRSISDGNIHRRRQSGVDCQMKRPKRSTDSDNSNNNYDNTTRNTALDQAPRQPLSRHSNSNSNSNSNNMSHKGKDTKRLLLGQRLSQLAGSPRLPTRRRFAASI